MYQKHKKTHKQSIKPQLSKIKWPLLVVLSLCLLLCSSCMNLATTGAEVVYNRQYLTKKFEDHYISFQAHRALKVKTNEFRNTNISATTYHNDVLLVGQVPNEWQREKAEDLIKTIPKVGKVYNLLRVAGPSSTLTKISDVWITTKIKTQLLASNELDATNIKVITENGTVYLMGIIPTSEAKTAIRLASNTSGVRRVVKLFKYIIISNKMNQERI